MNKYRVIIPYIESKSKQRYKIEYSVEARNRAEAQIQGTAMFNAYMKSTSASWIRIPTISEIRVWRIDADLPQTPEEIDKLFEKCSSSNENEVYEALLKIRELEDSAGSSHIINLMTSPNLDLATLAIDTVGKLGDPTGLYALIANYKDNTHPKIKATIVKAASMLALPSDNILNFLTKALYDKDDRVRANAIEAMVLVKPPNLSEILLELFAKDNNNRIQANIITALWGSDEKRRMLDKLRLMLTDRDPAMRASAIYALSRIQTEDKAKVLASMLHDKNQDVARNAKKALFLHKEPESIKFWLQLLENDRDFEDISKEILKMGDAGLEALETFTPKNEKESSYLARLKDKFKTLESDRAWQKKR
ncbi:MAG: HEAT repeat domain-containing protein [Candidatus Riflebacteria bacterium]|nr:HEAT repeat domain-containing protein [Candidatus Riflebacteria bacterium]